jgi:hypothetical protein
LQHGRCKLPLVGAFSILHAIFHNNAVPIATPGHAGGVAVAIASTERITARRAALIFYGKVTSSQQAEPTPIKSSRIVKQYLSKVKILLVSSLSRSGGSEQQRPSQQQQRDTPYNKAGF